MSLGKIPESPLSTYLLYHVGELLTGAAVMQGLDMVQQALGGLDLF